MQTHQLLSIASITLVLVGCDPGETGPAAGPSKGQVAQSVGKGDSGVDWCEIYDWYDDGVCDEFCLEPDPDCGGVSECEAEIGATQLLVAIENGGAALLDAGTGQILHRYDTGKNAFGAVFTPDGDRAFVTDKDAGTLVEVDLDGNATIGTLAVGTTPQQPAITADGRMYIPLSGEAAIAVVDVSGAPKLLRKIPTGNGTKPHIVSLSPDGKTVWSTVQGFDPKVISIAVTGSGEDAPKEYRYDIVPRVVGATNEGAWFTGHHSTGLHHVKLADGVVNTPYMDAFGSASEARKQIEGVDASADGLLFALTHEGRKALVVAELVGSKPETLLDVSPLVDVPYWTTLDPVEEAVFVSIPNAGKVQAFGIEGCGDTPMWTADVGGKVKRMDVTEKR